MNKNLQNKNRKKRRNHMTPWKRILSLSMAVLLVVAVVLSSHLAGVLAKEDTFSSEPAETAEAYDETEAENMEFSDDLASDEEETEEPAEDVVPFEPAAEEETPSDIPEDQSSAKELPTEDITPDETPAPDASELALDAGNGDVAENGKEETETFTDSEEDADAVFSDQNNGIEFDLAKGNIEFSDDGYSGVDSDGNTVSGSHSDGNDYIIRQSGETETQNTIKIGSVGKPVTKRFNIYLAGININVTNSNGCPVYVNSNDTGKVYLILKNNTENIVAISSQEGSNVHAGVEKELNTNGLLCITCEKGYKNYLANPLKGHACVENGGCGILKAYADKAKATQLNNPYVSGAGIGSKGQIIGGTIDSGSGKITVNSWLDNLTIAGGRVTAYGAAGDGSYSGGGAGIGVGSCSNSFDTSAGMRNFNITGGDINAVAGDQSASCIGGGYRSNEINIAIYGGTIKATDRMFQDGRVRGPGIGAGGGGTQSGSPSVATVNIYGGTITATGQYGAAIGGAGGGDGTGSYTDAQSASQPAFVYIYGGNITATSTGTGAAIGTGGPLGKTTKGRAGNATVEISGGTINAKSDAGADIGGGGVLSTDPKSNGGSADIKISDGTITATSGGIGGGKANAGIGGDARITVSGGSITTPSIGGGNSTEDKGGDASVVVTNGSLTVAGKIGGGNSENGAGGNASINVSGGTLDCASIGGGNSTSGSPGAVTDASGGQLAGVVVTGGVVKAGTIGGGTNTAGAIGFATANISGGTIQGQFILANTDETQKCIFTMTGGKIDNTNLGSDGYPKAQENGGAVYLSDPNGEVSISGNNSVIQNCNATNGGAIYLSGNNGNVKIESGTIQNCTATNGGAVYMTAGTFDFSGGGIFSCKASENGGAVYLQNGTVTIENGAMGRVNIPNTAQNGAAVYMAGGNLTVNGGSIGCNKASVSGAGMYLSGGNMKVENGIIEHNTADENGGGAYLSGGSLEISGGSISANVAANGGGAYLSGSSNLRISGGSVNTNIASNGAGAYLESGSLTISGSGAIQNNSAGENGGGAYLAAGILTMESGTIDNNKAASDGAGAYLSGGSLTVENGTINSNIANKNGGGAYLQGGNLEINGGFVTKNTAEENGGGAYLSGGKLQINDGVLSENTAQEGAGAYVADGIVRMFGGRITGNKAKKDGGGMYVSSASQAADVVIRSGELSGNTAGEGGEHPSEGNGGAIAVVSGNGENREDTIIIGVCHLHNNIDSATRAFDAFDYSDEKDENNSHNHAACPVIKENRAVGNGGGIYMGSTAAKLNIYCLTETGNKSEVNSAGDSVMTNGGTVTIGDTEANMDGKDPKDARGNIRIGSSMLVSGGTVDIYGNMENPYFTNEILVNIQNSAGSFADHRKSVAGQKEYKIHYFENFKGSGTYKARQYKEKDKIEAEGSLFDHSDEGYRIVKWNTSADGSGKDYAIGSEIGGENDHSAWESTDEEQEQGLVLYAIWEKITYTVIFNPNTTAYSGTMEDQVFQYGEKQVLMANAYKVTGKRFAGWNTAADGNGTAYASNYSESRMTQTHGATITLYAQWVNCTHKTGTEHPGHITYTADDETDTITESCDCSAHTEKVQLKAATTYCDGKEHPASVTKSTGFYAEVSEVNYQYKEPDATEYGPMPAGEQVPKSAGFYKASITVEGQTVSVEYQLKSQSEGASIDAIAAKGQKFSSFNGENDVQISGDDAFTVQFSAMNLNTDFTTVPVLNISQSLPAGTMIIMQTNGKYYWEKIAENSSKTEIELNSFQEMGTDNVMFDYAAVKTHTNQTYRFVIDFSKIKAGYMENPFECKLAYAYADKTLTGFVNIGVGKAEGFGLTMPAEDSVRVTAPQAQSYNRWNDRSLVLKLASEETNLPGDASLTVMVGDKNQQYRPDANGNFVIPLTWAVSQDVKLVLNSDAAASKGQAYIFKANLYTGLKDGQNLIAALETDTGVALNSLSLAVPASTSPSLKITDTTGTHRLLTKEDGTLDLDVQWKNIDKTYTVNANIQKKTGKEYGGDLLQAGVTQGANKFSLGGITISGSYRLVITVTKDQRTVMTVPYYFIVQ